MKPTHQFLRLALAVAAVSAASTAQAELVYSPYFATADINGDLTNPLAIPVQQARTDFLSMVSGAQTENLESFASGTNASGLSLFGGKATILPPANGQVTAVIDAGDGLTGRYNTTPGCTSCNFLETAYSFRLAFGGTYSAFAFFGTDFSDFSGSIYIDLLETDASGNLVVVSGTRVLVSGPGALLSTNGTGDGSLLNFGWTDNSRGYAGMSFSVVQANTDPLNYDFIGFDDMVLGNFNGPTEPPPTDMPEPGSLALVALSLAGLAYTRRRTLRG
jgi:hypothetical protein